MNSIQIPFNSLNRGIQEIQSTIEEAISGVIESGWFVMGPQHEALESDLANYLGVEHAINVANGTDALEIALAAVGVNEGDSVITVANAGAYTSTATLLLGAIPRFCDVDPKTLLMSTETLTGALSKMEEKPSAIVVTHLYGAMAPMSEIMAVAKAFDVPVIEDCAQSFGATFQGKKAGSFGDVSTTSFYPTKNLGAMGDGGAVFTNNSEYAEEIKKMRQYGWSSKYHISNVRGKNSRLDEMQAAILRVKLPLLDSQNEKRKQIHSIFEKTKHEGFQLLNQSQESFIGHLAVAVSDRRDEARNMLKNRGIATEIHYPIPDYKQNFFRFTPLENALPVTEWASSKIFSVPLFPELTTEEVSHISNSLMDC